MPIVTAYDTLGEEGVKHSMQQTNASAIYCDPHLLQQLIRPLSEVKSLKHIIYDTAGTAKQEHIDALKKARSDVTVISFEEHGGPSSTASRGSVLCHVHVWLHRCTKGCAIEAQERHCCK